MVRAQLGSSGSFSIYALTPSPLFFQVAFHLGLVIAVAVTLGIGGRPILALHYVFLWSLYMTNSSFMDGGDALVAAAIPFLLLTRCYTNFTLNGLRVTRSGHARPAGALISALNNTGVLLIAAQLSIVYLMAGLYKVQGRLWQDGTALYYILRVPEFFWPGITPLVFSQGWLLVIGAYGTVLVSIFFPVLVWFRAGRPVAVLSMVGFHIAIGLLMGLTSFALIMIAADTVFVSQHVDGLRLRVRSYARRTSQTFVRLSELIVRGGRVVP
ncbi:hypothetical protein AX769_06200 [Frondihabitans sp. PAMC 28766]|uniref:HTTM domain-containing protein n=1 Tax=Frondihabitans sp. PAMC 28766 TaxID=1795630 RepID=UPI00078CD153|nr:HTTM domain-containing protein [Frondihabitans sp. PAMC 28766]AMM19820.1 hypothetical protein AX769_06200 [Frondihabitans sp. PAMC 28766]